MLRNVYSNGIMCAGAACLSDEELQRLELLNIPDMNIVNIFSYLGITSCIGELKWLSDLEHFHDTYVLTDSEEYFEFMDEKIREALI